MNETIDEHIAMAEKMLTAQVNNTMLAATAAQAEALLAIALLLKDIRDTLQEVHK